MHGIHSSLNTNVDQFRSLNCLESYHGALSFFIGVARQRDRQVLFINGEGTPQCPVTVAAAVLDVAGVPDWFVVLEWVAESRWVLY
jgi:hypothetical protein